MRRLIPLILVLCCAAVPAAAQAKTVNVIAGIGDQQADMFTNPLYQSLHLHHTRYFIRWDAIDSKSTLATADAFVKAAKASGVKVLMHISTNNYAAKKAKLPSVSSYKKKVGALIKRYQKLGVTEWGVWNEANHKSEPTWNNPTRAAQFYVAMKSMCSGCTIVALDVLDQAGANNWTLRWFKALPAKDKTRKLIVGIHNYSDVNRNRSSGTKSIIAAAKKRDAKAKFWFTETGGIKYLKGAYSCNAKRQATATTKTFSVAKQFDNDVERLYTYNWRGTDCTGFDAGLINADGTKRSSYDAFVKALKGFKRS